MRTKKKRTQGIQETKNNFKIQMIMVNINSRQKTITKNNSRIFMVEMMKFQKRKLFLGPSKTGTLRKEERKKVRNRIRIPKVNT